MIGLRDYIKDLLRPDEDYGIAFVLLFFFFSFFSFVAAAGGQPGGWARLKSLGEIQRTFYVVSRIFMEMVFVTEGACYLLTMIMKLQEVFIANVHLII